MRCVIALLLCLTAAAAPVFDIGDRSVTVRTERYSAVFADGCLTRLENRLTGELLTVADDTPAERLASLPQGLGTLATLPDGEARYAELGAMHNWQGSWPLDSRWQSMHHPGPQTAFTAEARDRRCRVRWTGLHDVNGGFHADEWYQLDLEVLADSGDLAMVASAASPNPGVFANGVALTGLRRDLKMILPIFQGFWFYPSAVAPQAFAAHWPQPWHAGLVIAESARGSLGLWTADPEMRDRYLHLRNGEEQVDIVIESVNQAPFAGLTRAVGRPLRLNVYDRGWMAPAAAFRDWWATTFDVKPIAERSPSWLKDIGWIVSYPTLPPPELAPNTIFFAPQIWKKQPPRELGDTGLFPIDIEQGPELNRIADILPKYHDMGGHMMVYLNIDHMSKGHPWAGKYWDHRKINPFGKPKDEEDPKFGASSSFNVHCAYEPWQEIITWWAEESWKRFGIRGFYMDCARGTPNATIGLVNGQNDCQGQVALMQRIKAAIPGCFLGAEYLTEVTAQVADNADIGYDGWFGPGNDFPRGRRWREAHVHPIQSFLFSPYVHIWFFSSHVPTFGETLGRLPNAGHDPPPEGSITDFCQRESWMHFRALFYARHRPRIVFPPEPWPANVRAWYRDKDGVDYQILAETPTEGRMVRLAGDPADRLVYWRIKGRADAAIGDGRGMDGWVAYDGDRAIGLHPDRDYLYLGAERHREWEVTALPTQTAITWCRPFADRLVLELDSLDGEERRGELELLTTIEPEGLITSEGAQPLPTPETVDGRRRYRVPVTVPGIVVVHGDPALKPTVDQDGRVADLSVLPWTHHALMNGAGIRVAIEPRRQRQPDAHNLRPWPEWGGHSAVDYVLDLPPAPAGKRLVFRCTSELLEWKNNNVLVVLKVNGREVHREQRRGATEPFTHVADLTEWAGQRVVFTIGLYDAHLFGWLQLRDPILRLE